MQISRFIYHPFVLILVTLLAIGLWISFLFNGRELQQSSSQIQTLQTEVAKNEQEVASLEAQLNTAKSNFSQEAIIRNELLMQKPGEYIVQMPDLPTEARENQTSTSRLSPWQQWKALLLK